ncbi:tumor necrosis factor receptor superfamily member 21 isoform X2 [Clupea harengus]|uniref:Tumor necrosis factor receptor superfamily member 21 isoform X2 n=1 Tax=Clupea harengus TaxID=7950 RepID=A0A6P8F4S2_CLUHA|nr:tumor necrosis factor receptor superfamily member 21 isoform X2 [Clupea harengus]
MSASCPQCGPGSGQESCKCVPCKQGYYSKQRHGAYTCDTCTDRCSGKLFVEATKHLVQIKDCGISTNRVCHCTKGFYCPEPLNYTCLFNCKPCPRGTFSDEASLAASCKPHTDCDRRGLVTVSEGKATQDRVCDTLLQPRSMNTTPRVSPLHVSHSAPSFPDITHSSRPATEDSVETTYVSSKTEAVLSDTTRDITRTGDYDSHTTQHSSKKTVGHSRVTPHFSSTSDDLFGTPPVSPTTPPGPPDSSGASGTSAVNRPFTRTSVHDLSTRQSAIVGIDSQSSQWLVVLLLLLAVSVLVGCFLWLKSKALKKQLKWTRGLPFGKYAAKKTLGGCNICVPQHQQEADMGGNACLEQLIPLTRDSEGPLRETGAAAQPHPGQGSMQRITVDNNGKGESISNTVGSIFIYSPGMVVLGTNAPERKEEVRQEAEEQHLAFVPQQESPSGSSSGYSSGSSSSCQDSVGLSTQEEDDDKELSYPIPASSK